MNCAPAFVVSSSIKKITKAQELIATSRISRAQARVAAAKPYAEEITKVLGELAGRLAESARIRC